MSNKYEFSASARPIAPRRKLRWCGVIFAIVFPSLVTWGYFVLAGRYSMGGQQIIYLAAKIIQFAFPAVWTLLALRESLRTARPTVSGLLLGALFSVAVVTAGMALFKLVLRDTAMFSEAAALIHRKIDSFGIDTAWKYAVLAGFYSLFHSLLEEYYWRWFVFRQLRQLIPLWPAVIASAMAFTMHHIIVLNVFFKGTAWLIVLLSAGVAVGGAFWAWLYGRSNSMFDTWLSHLIIDAGIFFGVGFELLQHTFTSAS